MSFNSLTFLIFLPIIILGYYLIPHRFRWIWLLGASYVFYLSWNYKLGVLILGTTLVSYLGGIIIDKAKTDIKKKITMIVCIVICLTVLIVFKYLDFILESIYFFVKLADYSFEGTLAHLILPVGISFYTFQTLSYVIDVYRGSIKAEYHFGYYALFVSFFPQLVAGPIERPENLLPQLKEEHKANLDDFAIGFSFLLSGFIKKVLVADFIGTIVDAAYANYMDANGLALFLSSILFFVQVFCDFSGYSDIATGCARMMGIKLSKNFGNPFGATSFQQQWSQWHISLNNWFDDYVFTPLNYKAMNSKHIKFRIYLNLVIVMVLSGLWHGANWTFVLWGLFTAFLIILEKIFTPKVQNFALRKGLNLKSPWYLWFKRVAVLCITGLASVFFRSQDIAQAGVIFGRIFTSPFYGGLLNTFTSMNINVERGIALILSLIALGFVFKIIIEKPLERNDANFNLKLVTYYIGILVVGFAWLLMISNDAGSAFIYFQF